MTDIAPSCPTLVESPDDPTASLVCFLSEGHDDGGWHYDLRGLGASFRVDDGDVTVRLGVSPREAAEQGDTPPPNLPAPIGGADGQLDADALRQLAPRLRADLIAALRHSATQVRQARGTVVTPEDTYDLVRRLTSAGESLRSMRDAFDAAAKEADSITEEEALAVSGAELDGVLLASLFVPDGEGQRIAVRADRESSSSAWDIATLVGWIIEQEVAEQAASIRAERRERQEARQAAADPNAEGVEPPPLDPINVAAEVAWYPSDAQAVAHEVVMRLLALGRYTPGAKPIEALRKKLAEQQRDADAAVIRQVRTVTPGAYKGVKITREPAP